MFKNFNFTSYKFLAVTAAFFALANFASVFEPVGLFLKSISSKIRLHDASGEFVIVSIDDYAKEHGLSTPLPVEHATSIFESLLEAGAQKIVISEPVSAGSPDQNLAFKKITEAHADRLFVAEPWQNRQQFGAINWNDFISSPVAVYNEKQAMFWGGVEEAVYTRSVNGRKIVSSESVLTGVYGPLNKSYTINYGIDVNSLLYVPFDATTLAHMGERIKGRHIIVGYETLPNARLAQVPGQTGKIGLPTIITLGAETLRQGKPRDTGWVWGFCIAIIAAWYMLGSPHRRWQMCLSCVAVLIYVALTIALDTFNISIRAEGAICLILFVTPFAIIKASRAKMMRENGTHPDSNLPTINALRLQSKVEKPLIVCRMEKFDELMGLLSPEQRITLAERISSLATTDSAIWHGDDGHFYWLMDQDQAANLDGHIESLSVIMRNGFSIGHFPISMQTVFGLDLRYDQKMSDRIMAANLAAKQAASKGEVWRTYEAADQNQAAWEITQLRELDVAINSGEVYALLQPKVDIKTGEPMGAEALARWNHGVRGHIRPDEFVETAENGGRIKELTVAIMRSAFEAVRPALIENPDFTVSVNITPSLLIDQSFCNTVSTLLSQYEILPQNLILEVTESTAFSDNEACLKTMHQLVSMGIKLSIDDYGTGNSTLDYLRKIPARELKIDRAFVRDILTNDEDRLLVQSTIRLAHKLNMTVIAEGVEDSATLEKLKSMGCDQVQGYLIARPLNPDDFLQFISNIIGRKKVINNS